MVQASATLEKPGESAASPIHPEEPSGWAARPGSALLLRSAIFVAPIVASAGASYLVATTWSRPDGFVPTLVWLVAMMTAGAVAMIVIDRVARRFLPLTALLRMTLIFPDQAPSRFNIALRTGTTKQLEARLDHVRQHGLGTTESEAAETLLHLAAALRDHDRYTRGHGERVRAYTALIGEEMGLSPLEISKLQWAGLIHDIGKLAIPEEVLNKPGRLTAEEYELIKTHPAEGMALMGPLTGWLGEWALAVGEHHERWDGGGYPKGLAGTDISLAGRVVAVADTFDVITATRSYKPAQSPQWARRELADNAGTQFDPEVVRAFLNLSLGQLRGVMWPLSWIASIPFIGSAVTAPASGVAVAAAAVMTTSIAGGSMAGAVPPDDGPIPRTAPAVAESVEEAAPGTTAPIDVTLPPAATTTIVVRLPVGATGAAIADGTNAGGPAAGKPATTIVVTLPADQPVGDVSGLGTGVSVIVVPPPTRQPAPSISNSGQTGTIGTTGVTGPTVIGGTGAVPIVTVAPTTTVASTTTVPPTTTAVASACDRARAGSRDLAGADLSRCDLSGATLDGVDLTGANLAGADLRNAQITNVVFDGAVMRAADLSGAVITGGTMRSIDAVGLAAVGATFVDVDLSGSVVTAADLTGARFTRTSLAGILAGGVSFDGASFEDVSFDGATLNDSDFASTLHVRVSMRNAIASDSSFELALMPGVDLRGADLREAEFERTDLTGARLDDTRIDLAQLERTNLQGATGTPIGAGTAEYEETVCPSGTVQSTSCWP